MPNFPDWLSITLSVLLMLIGLAGVVVPVLPGVPLIWLGALAYALMEGFGGWGGGLAFAFITVLMIAAVAVDLLMGQAMAKRAGASWQAVLASIVFGLVGLILFPPLGALIGAGLGMFAVEYWLRGKDVERARRAVLDYAAGLGWSLVVQFGLGLAIVGTWVLWVLIRRLGS